MLVSMKEILADAVKNGYAAGGFNCASLESAMGAIRASEELGIEALSLPNELRVFSWIKAHRASHSASCCFLRAAFAMVSYGFEYLRCTPGGNG